MFITMKKINTKTMNKQNKVTPRYQSSYIYKNYQAVRFTILLCSKVSNVDSTLTVFDSFSLKSDKTALKCFEVMNFLLHAIHNDNNISRVPTKYKFTVLTKTARVFQGFK